MHLVGILGNCSSPGLVQLASIWKIWYSAPSLTGKKSNLPHMEKREGDGIMRELTLATGL